jgi:hypothetical protein
VLFSSLYNIIFKEMSILLLCSFSLYTDLDPDAMAGAAVAILDQERENGIAALLALRCLRIVK